MKVSIITPTWQRHHLLLARAIPSARAQNYTGVMEHIVVSDGPDPMLKGLLAEEPVTYLECPEHDEHSMNFGSTARNWGLDYATGDFIAYLDDDNSWRPDHLSLLIRALEINPEASFSYGLMITHPHEVVIGSNPPQYTGIDTSMIVQRRQLMEVSRWPHPSAIAGDQHAPDWAIVEAWLNGGAKWAHVPQVTVDYYFAGS
jgi:glycosyltransferase involved in cell wall biosynthesis